ncbi:unnamed protein product [Candida verbasci]|uniref:Meiotic sister chromatid recombination protein 1 n=1 Tax=Candida verbasci TaxID=1227364 RepID=A0A9W4TR62_9ASCO|nr:unnamed protein product [Candida verbasci]
MLPSLIYCWLLLFIPFGLSVSNNNNNNNKNNNFNPTDFNQWSNNDLTEFLRDRKIEINKKWDNSKLISLAENELKNLQSNFKSTKDQIDKLIEPKNSNLEDYLNFNYLFNNHKDKKNQQKKQYYKDYIFNSWNLNNVQNFAKKNGIKIDKNDQKFQIIDKIKDSFDQLVKKNSGSNYYPGDWLYNSWSIKDLQQWLKEYQIEFNPNSKKDELISQVKKYNYQVQESLEDSKNSLFNSLNLFDKTIFDKTGQIKDDFFETWSYSQLREWLYLHGFIDTKPDVYVKDLSKDNLIQTAKQYKNYLLDDIHQWLNDTEKNSYVPWLQKGNNKNKKNNVINDTFLLNIQNWSKDKLREFLNVRQIPYSIFTTKSQLIELVKKHKFDPVHSDETIAWILKSNDDESKQSLISWLKEQGQNIEGDLASLFKSTYLKFGSGLNNVDSQIRLHKPNVNEYKIYLEKNLDPKKYEQLTDEKIETGFQIVEGYFNKASEIAKSQFSDKKYEIDQALQDIEDASYEYSVQFLDQAHTGKKQISQFVKDAQLASEQFVKSLTGKLIKDWENVSNGVQRKISEWWFQSNKELNKGIDQTNQKILNLKNDANEAIEKGTDQLNEKYKAVEKDAKEKLAAAKKESEKLAKDFSKKTGEAYDEAAKVASEKYEEAKQYGGKKLSEAAAAGGELYEEGKVKAGEYYDEASKIASQKYDEAVTAGGAYYDEASKLAAQRYDEGKTKASELYEQGKKIGDQKYKEGKVKAGEYYDEASKIASQKYDEGKVAAGDYYDQAKEVGGQKYEEAKKIGGQKYDEALKVGDKHYVNLKYRIKDLYYNLYTTILYYTGFINYENLNKSIDYTNEKIGESFDTIFNILSNADLKSYLQSFGYNYKWLSKLNRKQLIKLAEAQNKVFHGYDTNFDKSIGDIIKDTTDEVQYKLGLKKKPESFAEKLKSFLLHIW